MFILKKSLVEQAFSLQNLHLRSPRMCLSLLYMWDYVVLTSVCVYGLEVWLCRHTMKPAATQSALVADVQTQIYAACVPKCGDLP